MRSKHLAEYIVWTAAEATAAYFAWKLAVVPAFGVRELAFGHIFCIWAAIKFMLWDFTQRLTGVLGMLVEIRDLLLFSEQNSALKYNSLADWAEKVAQKYFASRKAPKDPE